MSSYLLLGPSSSYAKNINKTKKENNDSFIKIQKEKYVDLDKNKEEYGQSSNETKEFAIHELEKNNENDIKKEKKNL